LINKEIFSANVKFGETNELAKKERFGSHTANISVTEKIKIPKTQDQKL
jgi:hypothetical protein